MRPYTERPLGEKNLYYQSGMEEIFHELWYYEGDDYGRTLLMTNRLAYVMERIRRQGAPKGRLLGKGCSGTLRIWGLFGFL